MARKLLLINRNFQLSFIRWISGICFSVVVIFYSANLYFFKSYFDQGKALGLPSNHVFFTFMRDQFVKMNWIFLLASLTAFVVIYWVGLVLSHRVAGPINKITNELSRAAQGQPLMELKFRKKDYFPELADAYNQHVKSADNGRKLN